MQINAIDVPPKLFERLLIPAAVNDELSHPRIPVGVGDWIAKNEGGPTPCFETRRSAPTIEQVCLLSWALRRSSA